MAECCASPMALSDFAVGTAFGGVTETARRESGMDRRNQMTDDVRGVGLSPTSEVGARRGATQAAGPVCDALPVEPLRGAGRIENPTQRTGEIFHRFARFRRYSQRRMGRLG